MRLSREAVLDVVRAHPGAGAPKIVRLLGDGATIHTVDAHLNRAVRAGQVGRFGSRGRYTYRVPGEPGSTTTAMEHEPPPPDDERRARIAALKAFSDGCEAFSRLAQSVAKLLDAVRADP